MQRFRNNLMFNHNELLNIKYEPYSFKQIKLHKKEIRFHWWSQSFYFAVTMTNVQQTHGAS